MWTSNFWKATGERAVKSFFGGMLSFFGIDAVAGFDAINADWINGGSYGLGAALASVVFSLLSASVNDKDSPSVTSAK